MAYDFTWRPASGANALQGYGLPDNTDLAADARLVVETLTTPGVPGSRMREIGRQWPLLEIATILPAATYADLLALEDQIQDAVGKPGSLTLSFGGEATRTWPTATLISARTRRTGKFIGPVATTYSLELFAEIMRQEEANA
jgi:hypothetical protein